MPMERLTFRPRGMIKDKDFDSSLLTFIAMVSAPCIKDSVMTALTSW